MFNKDLYIDQVRIYTWLRLHLFLEPISWGLSEPGIWRTSLGKEYLCEVLSQLAMQVLLSTLIHIAQLVKNPPAMQETPVQFLGQEDLLEKR